MVAGRDSPNSCPSDRGDRLMEGKVPAQVLKEVMDIVPNKCQQVGQVVAVVVREDVP